MKKSNTDNVFNTKYINNMKTIKDYEEYNDNEDNYYLDNAH